MPRAIKSDLHHKLAEAQRAYLQRVQRETKLTLSQIARESGSNHVTVTKFMNNPEHGGALSALTIAQISERFRIPASSTVGGMPGGTGLSEDAAEPYMPGGKDDPFARAINALMAGRNGCDPWMLRTSTLEDAGYLPGDVVIVDQNMTARAKDAVCAQVYDWDRMKSETVWRVFDPPFLIGANRNIDLRPKPITVDNDRVVIKGVITDLLRRRASG